MYSYLIPETLNKERIDKAIVKLCQEFSRSQIQKSIKNQKVTLNGKVISDFNEKVNRNDEIIIEIEPEVPNYIEAKKIDFDLIYEDTDLMVINKPIGLTVHPGAGNYHNTLVNGLLYYSNHLSDVGGEIRPGIVHRLDKDTSGLMVVAKNNYTHNLLAAQITTRDLHRKYKALIWGTMKPFTGVINMPISRCTNDRLKMTTVRFGGKEAITHYKTLEVLKGGLFSLLECTLETGRTHQIRVHLSHSGHSIVGDQVYGNNTRKISGISEHLYPILNSFQHQALHSYYISFMHPRTNKLLEFEIEIEPEFLKLIEQIRRN
ncbi:MAG: RluA family pseudouridine synthase [Rickettsiaceae bacterium]|nr:RluA family pseudouridine synthase [Rickettsiaceae bacterium]